MNKPLDELYFVWLYSQVGDPEIKNPDFTYWGMLKQLFTKEFIWLIPNDDNRIGDGKDLRSEFVDTEGLQDVDLDWMNLGCSMLELLIGLSRRLSFEVDGEPRDWFWHLIRNLKLDKYTDKNHVRNQQQIDDILDRVIFRTYHGDGQGGIFPLRHARRDQREVELWYQLNAYVLEAA